MTPAKEGGMKLSCLKGFPVTFYGLHRKVPEPFWPVSSHPRDYSGDHGHCSLFCPLFSQLNNSVLKEISLPLSESPFFLVTSPFSFPLRYIRFFSPAVVTCYLRNPRRILLPELRASLLTLGFSLKSPHSP